MDRMSPLDASFLRVEDAVTHMHIGAVAVFQGPAPSVQEVRAMVTGKLPLVPRYRQKIRFVPGGLGRPVWVDDPYFRLGYHLRQTALPAPGGDHELRNLVGRLMSQQLDRTKPLWEMWTVEGLSDGHWALVSKVHHCMVDGIAGTDLLALLLDAEPTSPDPLPDSWVPRPEPSADELVLRAVLDLARSPGEQVRAARATLRRPRALASSLIDVAKGLTALGGVARPTTRATLTGPIGPHRVWSWAKASLDEVKVVRHSLGGTVNDVVLAVITLGFRELLLSRGEDTFTTVLRSLVPVSVRASGERGVANNRVSAVFAELPVGRSDAVDVLSAIRAQMDGLKDSKQAVAGEALTALSGFAPATLLTLGARLASRLPQRSVHTVTTNVPGPQVPLYAMGRRLLEVFPFVPLGAGIRIGVAVFSYAGRLTFGLTGDYDHARDLDVLAAGIEDGVTAMVKAARGNTAGD